MIVKLSDSQVGLVFKFDSDSDEHMITKREAAPDTQYGMLKMEVLNLSSSETFPLLINTRTDHYRMYSAQNDESTEYMENTPHEIVETPEVKSEVPGTNSGRLYANEQGLVFFKRGLYQEALNSFKKAQETTNEQALEDNILFAIASYIGANDNMRFASKPTALKVFRHLDFLMGTRHKDIARVIWLCLYWQYGKSQINTVRLNSQFEELQQQQVKEISDIYCTIMSPIQRNVSSTTRSLFLNFKFV